MKKILLATLLLALGVYLSAGTITVIYPNGGENLTIGNTVKIRWNASGISGNVKISILKDGVWLAMIKTGVPASAGEYNWVVGQKENGADINAGSSYKIRVKAASGEEKDESNNPFTISSGTTIDWSRVRNLLQRFKFKPEPFPNCPQCFTFDIKPWLEELIRFRKVNRIDDDVAWRIELHQGGAKIIELGIIGRGSNIPFDGKVRLSLNENQRNKLKQGGLKMIIVGPGNKILFENGVQAEELR